MAKIGTSCPDHFKRTKKTPIVLNVKIENKNDNQIIKDIENDLEAYRKTYSKYYSKNKRKDSPKIRDSNPIIFLIPKIGMISFAKDKTNARLASEFYLNAINVMNKINEVKPF